MDDLISRQAAIDLWEKYHHTIAVDAMQYDAELRQLPSAQPRKKGKWIEYNATGKKQWMCSECCAEEKNPKVARFCYWCGALMKGEEDERIKNS